MKEGLHWTLLLARLMIHLVIIRNQMKIYVTFWY